MLTRDSFCGIQQWFLGSVVPVGAPGADVVHWTLDADDPSHGVALSIQDVTYDHRLLLNQPVSEAGRRLLPK